MKLYLSTLITLLICANPVASFICEKLWNSAIRSGTMGASQSTTTSMNAAGGIPSCPPGSQNCILTTWKPPKGQSKGAIGTTLMNILKSYPQGGQAGVDKGGWTIVSGDLTKKDTISLEYKSGIGTFAFLLNGRQPFIDDLIIKIVNTNEVVLRSSSRIGQSDLGVNKKRLQYLGAKAKALGWDVPEPKY